jgi:microcystin-dependent protein
MANFPDSPAPDEIHSEEGQSWQWKTDRWIIYDPTTISNIYPIGSVFLSVNNTNPGTLFPGTTWIAFEGRAIVGVGTNGESTWTAGQTRGSETHQLSLSETPSHTHSRGTLTTSDSGAHTHLYYSANAAAGGGSKNEAVGQSGSDNTHATSSNGSHTHAISGNTGAAGGNAAHNNVQPSLAVYMWQRTA